MSRDERIYLEDMLAACQKIRRYILGLDQEGFVADERTYDAVIRNLEIVGEAAKHVSDATRSKLVDIEWRKVSGLRDVLAHAYFGIDEDLLWDIVHGRVPLLEAALRSALADEEQSG